MASPATQVCTFKVVFGDFSAILILAGEQTLYELASAIIDAVGFDMDHSFGFYSKPTLARSKANKESYTLFADLGEDEEGPGVQKTSIASVFRARKKMHFLFDYGDEWWFEVTCLKTGPLLLPFIVTTEGKPPEQYPEPDDE